MLKVLHRIGWIGLTLVGGLLLLAVALDLSADHTSGLPGDHQGAFTSMAGQSFADIQQSSPGVARYITHLEVGYALHELTFAVLFLAIVLIPLRQRKMWGWWAAWAIMIANVGYTFTIACWDPAIFRRSLFAVIVVPLLLVLSAPAVWRGEKAVSRGATAPDA